MATSSPIPNNKVAEPMAVAGAVNGNTPPQRPSFLDPPKQNLRGLNKPKCIKCGNVARSRCPFQSCKSCCFKADNPCYIHVLKQSTPLPDNLPPPSTPSIESPSVEAPSTGTSWRLSLLRQLSTNAVNSVRARRPLTAKDSVNVNKWRFSKLREHIRRNLDAESEAFERYLRNVSLLEETFSVNEGLKLDDHPTTSLSGDKIQELVSTTVLKLKSNAEKADIFRERLRKLVDLKLKKLREWDPVNEGSPFSGEGDTDRELKRPKMEEGRAKRTTAVNDLVEKLINAQSDDDLNSLLEMKSQLFNPSETKEADISGDSITGHTPVPKQESNGLAAHSYSLPETCRIVPIDEEALFKVSEEYSSLNEIVEL